ncbi:hypothetical protein U8607_08040 [Methylobacterium durans]|uniref:hypothetical protein n=1 Tax=Methylobacterium durans TaxID=2202825 RepID=UPI0013A57951|nr:hypothetical protein [Methylobacterium durans]MEA1832031.1 hypothetical protein [Methylobacterium durans]
MRQIIGFRADAAVERPHARVDLRYSAPASLHPGAAWIAAGTTLLGTLALLGLRLGFLP